MVTITGSTSITAFFTQIEYILDITTVGSGTVSADKQPPYYYNDLITLSATADPGWSFAGWEGACSGNGECQVIMNENKAVTAVFTDEQYILDVTIIGNGSVTPDNPGPYSYGAVVELTATPDPGWSLSEWSVEGCTGNTCTVTMYGDQNVIVTFTEDTIEYTLTTNIDGNGVIVRDPDAPTYPQDTMVTLQANPDPGWFFHHWAGDCSGANPCVVTMDSDKTVTAFFTQGQLLPQNLILSSGAVVEGFESTIGWTVSGSGTGYAATLDTVHVKDGNASIRLTTPASGSVYITKPVTWDLSANQNQGNFRLWVYVSGASEPTGGSIILSSDPNFANYYYVSYGGAFKLRNKPGWNLINLRTADWRVGRGLPNWNNIVLIRIRLDSKSVNDYSFDALTSGVVAQPVVLFTFDKGLSSLYSQAFTYMQARNVRGTGYIPTNWVGTTGRVTWEQLWSMFLAGWTIGNQTMSDVNLASLDYSGQVSELSGAQMALNDHGITTGNHVAYANGSYNSTTLTVMQDLNMLTGRTLLNFNNLSPLTSPFEIAQRLINKNTTLATAQGWVDTAMSRQEILVVTIQGLSTSPGVNDWYIARFQSLIAYCISQGIPIITMDDLYQLQSGDVTIPTAIP